MLKLRNIRLVHHHMIGLAGLCIWLIPAIASAHQIWMTTITGKEDTFVHVGFGEPDRWDRKNVRKIEQTQYSLRSGDGQLQPLTAWFSERGECYVAQVSGHPHGDVVATCDYGVSRHGAPALVTFHAKRPLGGLSESIQRATANELPLELYVAQAGSDYSILAIANGQPLANQELIAYGPRLPRNTLKTDEQGRVTWKAEGNGEYSIFVMQSRNEPGTRGKDSFEMVRVISSLSFTVAPTTTVAQLAPSESADNAMLEGLAGQSLWPADFAGFAADIEFQHEQRLLKGGVRVNGSGRVQLQLAEASPELQAVASQWLESLSWHRAPRNVGPASARKASATGPGHGQPTGVAFAAEPESTDSLIGREMVPLNDPFGSHFWMHDGHLKGARRQMGDRVQTITVLDTWTPRANGHEVPTQIHTGFWNLQGELTATHTENRQWTEVGGVILPARLTRVECREGSLRAAPWQRMTLVLSNHQLLSADDVSAGDE